MPDKIQDGYDENSMKRFGEYVHDMATMAGMTAKSFASAAKAMSAAGSAASAVTATLARRSEEDEAREVLLDNLRSPSFHFDESVPSSPHQRPSQEGSLHLQALANHEPLHIAMREVANIGMSTDEVENAVSILANQTPRPTIRMIRFRKE